MKIPKDLPVLSIKQFEDYNQCRHFENNFYIRKFDEHLKSNRFLDDPHGHDFFIILLITEGSGVHNIDFHSYKVEPGTVFFLSPGQVHNWQLSEDIDGYIIFFTKEYFLLDFTFNKLNRFPFFYTHLNSPYLKLDEKTTSDVEDVFFSIEKEYQDRKHLFNDLIRMNLYMLLIKFERVYKKKSLANHSPYHLLQLNNIENLIDEHYKSHKTVTDYAEMMHMTVKQLSTLCKKMLNKTPSDLIQARIILEAKRLLIHSEQSVSAISDLLNFNDYSYFIRLFKKVTNMTPEQFRTASLKKHPVH